MIRVLEALNLVFIWNKSAYLLLRWAEREMHPLHPDKPYVVLRLAHYERKLA